MPSGNHRPKNLSRSFLGIGLVTAIANAVLLLILVAHALLSYLMPAVTNIA
jgi:hypothetical protein